MREARKYLIFENFRIMLMEEEAKKSEQTLANTVTKLAVTSKEADDVLKKVTIFIRIGDPVLLTL